MPGPLGTETNRSVIDDGTNCLQASPIPGSLCGNKRNIQVLDPATRKLAAIAYGEASAANDRDEIGGIAFAVANRARAWDGKTVDELLRDDPNYTYAVKDGNPRYDRLMNASEAEIEKDPGMKLAVEMARNALANFGADPSNGASWWDGVDFKTNYDKHPKVKDGFRFGSPSHNIFSVKESSSEEQVIHWKVRDKKGELVDGQERGRYKYIWISTAAHGKTIFWRHSPEYLKATGCKEYK